MEQILDEFEKKIEPHLKEMNLELADLEYVRDGGYNYLRVYVEKLDRTTTLDDCIDFSREIDGIADDLIEEKFFLEVSTPGVERRLRNPKDFVRFSGEIINVQAKSNIDGVKRFLGKLEKFENDTVFLLDDKSEKIVEIPLSKLKKANLIYELPNGILNSEEE